MILTQIRQDDPNQQKWQCHQIANLRQKKSQFECLQYH